MAGFDLGADVEREEFLQPKQELDVNTRQRRVPGGKFIIPEDEAPSYDPPEEYPQGAQTYLKKLARTGTMSAATLLTGISAQTVYRYRDLLDGFKDEEERAKDIVTDWIEEQAFAELTDKGTTSAVRMKEFMLKTRRRKVYGDRQEVEHTGNVQISWLDLLKQEAGGAK